MRKQKDLKSDNQDIQKEGHLHKLRYLLDLHKQTDSENW